MSAHDGDMTAPVFLDATAALMERTARTIEALLGVLPPSWLDTPDAAGVVGHLISAEPLTAAREIFGNAKADVNALTLQVPSDGSPRSVRDVLDELDRRSIEVANLTPTATTSSLALTGQPSDTKRTHHPSVVRGGPNCALQSFE